MTTLNQEPNESVLQPNLADDFFLAILKWQYGFVKLLIKTGVNVNKGLDCFTPLGLAAMAGSSRIFRLLLENGAVMSDPDPNETMLHYAAEGGNPEIIEFLLRSVININAQDSDGNTALHLAASRGRFEAVKLLLEKGADPEIKNNEARRPLGGANDEHHGAVVKLLKSYMRDPASRDSYEYPPQR